MTSLSKKTSGSLFCAIFLFFLFIGNSHANCPPNNASSSGSCVDGAGVIKIDGFSYGGGGTKFNSPQESYLNLIRSVNEYERGRGLTYDYYEPIPGQCQNDSINLSTFNFSGVSRAILQAGCLIKIGMSTNDTISSHSGIGSCPPGWNVQQSGGNGSRGLPGLCVSPNNTKALGSSDETCGTPSCGNPINIFSGNKYQREVDYASADITSTLRVVRHYNSLGVFSDIKVGTKWRLDYDRRIRPNGVGTNAFSVFRGDGRILNFYQSAGAMVADGDIADRLTPMSGGAGGWQYYVARTEETETYNASGRLMSIVTKTGASQTLAYSDSNTATTLAPVPGLLIAVTDQLGRRIQFVYEGGGMPGGYSPDPINICTDQTGVRNCDVELNPNPPRLIGFYAPDGGYYQYIYGGPRSNYDKQQDLVGIRFPDQRIKQYGYNLSSNLTSIQDESGNNFATFTYAPSGRAISTEHFGGVEKYLIELSGGSPDIIDVTDQFGTVRKHSFEVMRQGIPRLTRLEQPCSTAGCSGTVQSTQTYDANANITNRTDFNGNRTCYIYDLTRNLETARVESITQGWACDYALTQTVLPGSARITTTTWHPTYRLPATITEPVSVNGVAGNKVTTNTYDTNGNLTQRLVTTPSGSRTWNWTYDQLGRVLTATDPLGRINTNTYYPNTEAQNAALANSRGLLASVTNPLGHTTNVTSYNANGQALSLTDANGLTTQMTYDVRQRITSRQLTGSAIQETTRYEYEATGKLNKVILPDNSFVTYAYDGAQRLTQITDGLGNKIVYVLDNMGNRIEERAHDPSGALSRIQKREMDALNRLKKTFANAEVNTSNGNISYASQTVMDYDNNGNPTKTTAPTGALGSAQTAVTESLYDALNRLTEVRDPENGAAKPTRYEYDAQDNLTKVTDPKNLATTYGYNGFNELINQTSPDTGVTSFTYDNNGNMLTKTDARNVTVTYSYDNLNRVTTINYPAVSTVPAQTITYNYDNCSNGTGRLCSFTDRSGTTSYSYDQAGRVVAKTQAINGAFTNPTQTVAYRYNAAGQMDQMTLPSGKKVAATYLNNRVTGLTIDGQPIVKTADYEPFGPIGEWTWGNDTVTTANKHTRYFDLDGRNTKIESGMTRSATNIPAALDPTLIIYDAASRITALQRLTTSTIDPTKSFTYSYDKLDRLTTVTPGVGNTANTQSYTYDAIGNRLVNSINGAATTYSYGTTSHRLNALTGATSKTFTYDNVGNRIGDGLQSWIYGGDNRPSAITLTGSTPTTIQSGINALGQRVLKTVNSASTTNIIRFVYDEAGRLIGEYDTTGRALQETIWLGDLPVAVLK